MTVAPGPTSRGFVANARGLRRYASQMHHSWVARDGEHSHLSVLGPSETARDQRVACVTGLLADVFAARATCGAVFVVVDGPDSAACEFADQLADVLARFDQPHLRLADAPPPPGDATRWADPPPHAVVIGHGQRWRANPPARRWDAVVYLRTAPAPRGSRHGDREHQASVVIDYHDPRWPVIRHLHPSLAERERWYLTEGRAFFAIRAATWDAKFGADLPAYAAAVAEAVLRPGDRVVDLGCGTGRALPALRTAVGEDGTVIGIDVTPEMLRAAGEHGRVGGATLVLADARCLPLTTRSVDAVFAAGLIQHLPDPAAGLAELARVTRPAGKLIIFHPSGRAALAARHGRTLPPDDPLAEHPLRTALTASGWRLVRYDDPPDRFFALAQRHH
jgi:SAM-dependent methyltransferase